VTNLPKMSKPASVEYNRPMPQEEKKRIVVNLYESGIGEEFIALQLDLEIPTVISILKEYDIYKGDLQEEKGN
jgi:DNA invertase Pin-like site-specific DNA recombinase